MPTAPNLILRTWGQNLRERRQAAALSREALAASLDPPVTRPTIVRWETGQNEPRLGHKLQVACALGTTVADLFPYEAAS